MLTISDRMRHECGDTPHAIVLEMYLDEVGDHSGMPYVDSIGMILSVYNATQGFIADDNEEF